MDSPKITTGDLESGNGWVLGPKMRYCSVPGCSGVPRTILSGAGSRGGGSVILDGN